MSKSRDRTAFQRDNGRWVNKRNDANQASSVHDTRAAANSAVKEMLKNQGDGERTTMGRDGRIVSRDTNALANAPRSILDAER